MKSLCARMFSEVSHSATDVRVTLLNTAVSLSDKFTHGALSCLALMF